MERSIGIDADKESCTMAVVGPTYRAAVVAVGQPSGFPFPPVRPTICRHPGWEGP